MAPKWDIQVVAEEWLYDSIERGMCLDESLYDVKMPQEERGKAAWNRHFVHPQSSLGKRDRNEDVSGDMSGRRKIRRTVSARLGHEQHAIWADIAGIPAVARQQDEWNQKLPGKRPDWGPTSMEQGLPDQNPTAVEHEHPQNDTMKHKTFTTASEPSGIFAGVSVYIHSFHPVKVCIKFRLSTQS